MKRIYWIIVSMILLGMLIGFVLGSLFVLNWGFNAASQFIDFGNITIYDIMNHFGRI